MAVDTRKWAAHEMCLKFVAIWPPSLPITNGLITLGKHVKFIKVPWQTKSWFCNIFTSNHSNKGSSS